MADTADAPTLWRLVRRTWGIAGPTLLAFASMRSGQAATGSIAGRVVYRGAVPPPTIVIEGGSTQQVLYVSKDAGLRYVAAFVARSGEAAAALPGDAAVLNQRGFIFEPQVLAVRYGQLVRFTNDDSANHNVRSDDAGPSNRFSLFTGYGERAERRFRSQPGDRPIAVGCDIHPWMRAWLYVFNHPSFAVTGDEGQFRIDHVPVGRHRVSFRQPAGGLQRDVGVEVVAGRTAALEVVFTAGDLPSGGL